MSIGSINSLSYAFGYQYYSDSEYLRIRTYLTDKGRIPTGDRTIDEQTYNQLKSQELMTQQIERMLDSSETRDTENKSGSQYIPWADFMGKVGLDATGDVDNDKARTITEIEKRIKNASSDEMREYYTGLLGQVNSEFNKPMSTSTSSVMDYSGAASILGNLNRTMLVHSLSG